MKSPRGHVLRYQNLGIKSPQTRIEHETQLNKHRRHLSNNTHPPGTKGHNRRRQGSFCFDKELRLEDSGDNLRGAVCFHHS